jgi:hypothetical protein
MSIESPKIEIKPEIKGETTKEKLEKKIRTMTAWGLISLSSLGVGKFLFREERKPELKSKAQIIELEKKQDLSLTEKMELQKKIDYLKNQFGKRIVFQLEWGAENNKEVKPKTIKVKNFDKIGLPNEKLKDLWSEKYYPKGWIDEEISEAKYSDKEHKMEKNYGIDAEASARSGSSPLEDKSKIIFQKMSTPGTKTPGTQDEWNVFIQNLDWHFSHEIGHANDWEHEGRTDFKHRVEFLYEVSNSCFTEGAYRDEYIDFIKNKDKNKENYYKTAEYWATICDHYFTVPGMFRALNPREFEMVDKYVKMEDPNYNPIEKQAQRQEIINQITEK